MGEAHARARLGNATSTSCRPSCSGDFHNAANMRNTLNRKYLSQAIDGSLECFGLNFVDLVYCHRSDPNTPIEETVWAMSDMVSQGQALVLGYVGVVRGRDPGGLRHRAIATASHKPLVEQPQYNILWRDRVEKNTSASTRTSDSARPSGPPWRRGC